MKTEQSTLFSTTTTSDLGEVLILAGELDLHGVSTLSSSGNREGARPEVIDLRRVSFVDAAGIRHLLELAGDEPIDVLPSDAVRRLIDICGLGERLRCIEPRRAVVRS